MTDQPIKKIKPEIILETDDFIAVNKPAGLLTLPDRFDGNAVSLQRTLDTQFGKIYTIHRLDRDTSGIILFAKNETAHRYFSKLFEERNVIKLYQGIVLGVPFETTGTVDAPVAEHPVQKGMMVVHRKGKASVTDYEVLGAFGSYALVQFNIHTGRTHQIRVHMKHIGHPIACDPIYGDGKPVLLSSIKKKYKIGQYEEEKPMLSRLALHSYQLNFKGPDGVDYTINAELPKDMRALLQQLSKLK